MELASARDAIHQAATLELGFIQLVNGYWGFYIGVSSAIAGWAIASKTPLARGQKIGLTVIFLLLAAITASALFAAHDAMAAAHRELAAWIREAPDALKSAELRDLFAATRIRHSPGAILAFHLAVDVAVLYLIWLKPGPATQSADFR